MRATLIDRCRKTAGSAIRTVGETADRTTNFARVLLEPGWLRRMFGARPTVLELAWHETGFPEHRRGWLEVASGRWLGDLPHAGLIRDALDFVPATGAAGGSGDRAGAEVNRWLDLDELRRDIAAQAKAQAKSVGLENVRVYVRIAEPDKRGQRVIEIDVDHQPVGLIKRVRR